MKALFYRLAHGVDVERDPVTGLLAVSAEHLQGTALGRRGEGEEAQVVLLAADGGFARKRILRGVSEFRAVHVRLLGGEVFSQNPAGAEDLLHLLRGLAGLGGVGLVHEHCVAAGGERLGLVEDERELLERRYDDAGGLPGQGFCELG